MKQERMQIYMSYAIIRNAKCKMSSMPSISRHNERQNKEYGNEDIDTDKSDENYHLKQPQEKSYEREFDRLKAENQLKGNLRLTGKKQSNVACEFLITSDNAFFKQIGANETKRYFETAYKFACNKCGEKNIISAVVHMDETTPHMHLTYIPVVEGKDKQGQKIDKVNCSEFWKGFNSYGDLQDKFHAYVKEHGFDLERGEPRADQLEHLSVNKYKAETLKVKVNDLEQVRDIYRGDLNALQDEIKDVQTVTATFSEIDAIEGKTVLFSKAKVTVDAGEFKKLKSIAKKQHILEDKAERLEKENHNLRSDMGKSVKMKMQNIKDKNGLEQENSKLRRGVLHLYKFLDKMGLKDKADDYIKKQGELEKQQLKANTKSFGRDR